MSLEHRAVTFGQTTIRYSVERRPRRRTIAIAVDANDGVSLKAPADLAAEHIDAVVYNKGAWIVQRMADIRKITATFQPRQYVNGESYAYLGRQYRLRITITADTKFPRVTISGRFLVVRLPEAMPCTEHKAAIQQVIVQWYRKRAAARLPERVNRYAEMLGVSPPSVLIRDQQKRWGSCNRDGELRFNWRIIMAPMSLVDYVVAHELCHLKGRNHSPAFWKWLRMVMPDYEERKGRLRIQGTNYRL